MGRWQSLKQHIIQPILQSSAARFYLVVWLIAAIYLTLIGDAPIFQLAYAVGVLLFAIITLQITEAKVPALVAETPQRRVAWRQVGIATFFIALTGYTFLGNILPAGAANVPLWSPLIAAVGGLGEQVLSGSEWVSAPYNFFANPFQFFIVPGIILLLAGVRPAQMGFRRGHRVVQVIAVWCFIPALVIIFSGVPLQRVVYRLISHSFQNGFFEEFLFRGALHAGLRRVIKADWALVIQALIFGIWHLGANAGMKDGNVLGAIAVCVTSQSVLGLGFGIILQRTRNLIAPSVFHVVSNTFGSL